MPVSISIPGIKVLDEILAGLPTNSAQRIEIGKLKEQIAALEKENGELKELNAILRQASVALIAKKEDELIRINDGYFKKDGDGQATGHPYCVHCWESKKQLSSLTNVLAAHYSCSSCGAHIQRGRQWPSR